MKKSTIGGSLIVLTTLSGCGTNQVVEPPQPHLAAATQPRPSGEFPAGRLDPAPTITLADIHKRVDTLLLEIEGLGSYGIHLSSTKFSVQTAPGKCPPTPPGPNKTDDATAFYRGLGMLMIAKASKDRQIEDYAYEDDRCWPVPTTP